MKQAQISIKLAQKEDQAILRSMAYLAIFVPPGEEPFPFNIVDTPFINPYFLNWGQKGDIGLIAWADDKPIGAAWARYLHGYGFVNEETPELTIAIESDYRNQGLGTQLLSELLEHVRMDGAPALSLSVSEGNDARRLYDRFGFQEVKFDGETYTMIKHLSDQ